MVYDIEMLKRFYASYAVHVDAARMKLGKAMTLAEKYYMHTYIMQIQLQLFVVVKIM